MLAQDQDRSISFARQTLEFARRAGEDRLAVLAMSFLVNQGIFDGNYGESETLYADALQIAQRLHDKVTLLQVYAARVELERYQGNYGRAIELCSIGLALAQEAGRSDWANNLSVTMAKLALRQGDILRAQSLLTAVVSQCIIPRDSYNLSLIHI